MHRMWSSALKRPCKYPYTINGDPFPAQTDATVTLQIDVSAGDFDPMTCVSPGKRAHKPETFEYEANAAEVGRCAVATGQGYQHGRGFGISGLRRRAYSR